MPREPQSKQEPTPRREAPTGQPQDRVIEGARRRIDDAEESELGAEIRERETDDRPIIPGAEVPRR